MVRTRPSNADNEQASNADNEQAAKAVSTARVNGRFQKGVSGNPAGRPKGSRNKVNLEMEQLLLSDGKKVTKLIIKRALKGDPWALKLYIERVIPPLKYSSINVELPELKTATDALPYTAAVIEATGKGLIGLAESTVLLNNAEKFCSIHEHTELVKIVEELKSQMLQET